MSEAPKWEWTQGDTNPYETQLEDDRVDQTWLLQGSVVFNMMRPGAAAPTVVINNGATTITSPTARTVKFAPTAQQTNIAPGDYFAQWVWTDLAGVKRTFPSGIGDRITIVAKIA